MHRDVIIMRGKPGNEVLNTTVTNTQTFHLFLLHKLCTSTATTAHLLLPIWFRKCYTVLCLLDCQYSEQLAQVMQVSFVSIRVYCTKEHCTMHTTMHAFHCCFFQRKPLYINCLHNRIFPKNGGCITAPPSTFWGGGAMAPPHVADPMA